MVAIQVENLHKLYHSKRANPIRALDGISFEVKRGQIYGLLGPNGAGKSTLVRILTTITTPTSGRAVVHGFDVLRNSLDVRRHIALVLQQTAVETMLSVQDNLIIYAHLHGMARTAARARMEQVLDEFDLRDKTRETAQDLSLGTKRRLQVARIFMVDSPILFLDEATTGMDPLMKRRVIERIRAEAQKGRTVLLTTQVLSEAEELCDTIMIMDHGKKLAAGTLEDLRRLSARLFRVSLSFATADGNLRERLAPLNPDGLRIDGENAELLFRGEEASLLDKLAAISRETPIKSFEVRGAGLEEIFVELVGRK